MFCGIAKLANSVVTFPSPMAVGLGGALELRSTKVNTSPPCGAEVGHDHLAAIQTNAQVSS
jgi:hypothetical protein